MSDSVEVLRPSERASADAATPRSEAASASRTATTLDVGGEADILDLYYGIIFLIYGK
jgi:hypothetical protein